MAIESTDYLALAWIGTAVWFGAVQAWSYQGGPPLATAPRRRRFASAWVACTAVGALLLREGIYWMSASSCGGPCRVVPPRVSLVDTLLGVAVVAAVALAAAALPYSILDLSRLRRRWATLLLVVPNLAVVALLGIPLMVLLAMPAHW